MIRKGESISARYLVRGEIGRGSMGIVYDAEDLATGTRVAVKCLKDRFNESDKRFKEKWDEFTNETAANEQLRSVPGIPSYHGAGEWRGTAYFVTDFIDGRPLSKVCAACPPFRAHTTAAIGVGLATTLAAVHNLGLVHRDVNPNNVMVGCDGSTYLLDLGIAGRIGEETTTVASRGYAPMEQVRLGLAEPTVDIHALGCTLIKAHVGEVPYGEDLQWNVGEVEHPLPAQIERDIEAPLRSLLVSMVQRDAQRRPQSMTEVIDRLTPQLPIPGSRPDPQAPSPDPAGPYRRSVRP